MKTNISECITRNFKCVQNIPESDTYSFFRDFAPFDDVSRCKVTSRVKNLGYQSFLLPNWKDIYSLAK